MNKLATRFLGDTSVLLSILSNLKSPTHLADHIRLTDFPILRKGFAIVSLAFLNKLHQVPQSVSATHSTAIKGDANNDAGAFHNFWYHFHSVNALCTASFILDAVFPTHSKGSKTQYNAVFVASEIVYNPAQTVARGATQTVFHNLFHESFRNHMIFVVKYK